jgi:hypothetical protein
MDSRPPATITLAEPARIWSPANIRARIAEPHILLTVVVGTLVGIPAPIAAWRAGAWPSPAERTQPMMTSSIWETATPESARAALMATDPNCGAVTVLKAPWKLPTGVRRAAKITRGSELMVDFHRCCRDGLVYRDTPP